MLEESAKHFLFVRFCSRFNEGTYLKDSRFTDGGGSKKILANIGI